MGSAQEHAPPRLVIADNETKLGGPEGCYFAALGADDGHRWGIDHRWLPGLPPEKRAAALDDYLTCIGRLDTYNHATPAYWRTALGIRDIEKSIFFNGLDQLWRLRHLLQQIPGGGELKLLVSDPGFARLAGKIAVENGWQVSIRLEPRWRRWWSRLYGHWQALRYLLTLAAPPGVRRPAVPTSADIVIATISTFDRIRRDQGKRDFMFGQLPDQLAAEGKKVVMFAQLVGETNPADAEARAAAPFPVRTFADLTGPLDAVWSFCQSLTARLRTSAMVSSLGLDLRPLIASDIARARWRDLPANMLLERAIGKLVRRSPNAVLLHSFENNAWESVCQDLGRDLGKKSVGLQHSALIRSHLKLYRNAMRPAPDAIIVSGPVYQQLMQDEFGHDASRLVCGFAVRQFEIYSRRPKTSPPGEPQRILVMLQEALTSPLFLDLVWMAFKGANGLTVTLRPHPAVPLGHMLANTQLRMHPPFRESTLKSLYEDLDAHDVAVCAGTTSELEAVALGVPCVFVDSGETVSANPIFADPALNMVATDAVELRAACEKLAGLPEPEFSDQQRAARAFFEGAFSKQSPKGFNAILKALTPDA